MKINLDKLSELESKYKECYLTTDAIQRMVWLVLEKSYGGLLDNATDSAYLLSFSTLEGLGIIEK